MKLGEAIEQLIATGEPICRKGWNGKGMFIYYVQANEYPATSPVAKKVWGEAGMVPYAAYLALKGANGIVVPWNASQVDQLADDWTFAEI